MDITTALETKRKLDRGGKRRGSGRAPASSRHPARELVDGVVRFNGSGGSGHTGPASSLPLTKRFMKPAPVEKGDRTRGGARSRRVRKNKWVEA